MLFENQYLQLRDECLRASTRQFLARGASVSRCERCQLATFACICPWRPRLRSRFEFVLLMHRDEVFKPTNTGRLIADALPGQTHVFCWSRTEPDPRLLALLAEPDRECFVVFPLPEGSERRVTDQVVCSGKKQTFILLDGTWKQGGRMFHLSQWMKHLPCLALPAEVLRGYAVRKSHQENYLSTFEAAALTLELADEQSNSRWLLDYFALFNRHYLATRQCVPPEYGEVHQRLARLNSERS